MPASTSSIGNNAPGDIAHKRVKSGIVKRVPVIRLGNSIQGIFAIATMLFFIVSTSVLNLMNWHYLGGGAEYEKIHIATYLLISAFVCLWLVDPRFRGNVTQLCCTDWILISFALAVGVVALYAILIKHVSITPFIDTFLAALLVTIGWICLPRENLIRLRYLLDLYFVANIAILFLEYAMKSWLVFPAFDGPFRAVAFFEGPLSAATLLGVYAIANLVSMPVRFRREGLIRLILGVTSLAAILTTGGRAAIAISILILFVFVAIAAVGQFASGRINRAAVVYGLFGLPGAAFCVAALLHFGFLETMLSRFEFDNGSASTRQIALDLAVNMPFEHLLVGLPQSELVAMAQQQVDLNGGVAIEISWVNFILNCGWTLTIPLFVTYFLFLVRFIPRYCGALAILPSIFLFIITASNNGIWAKTTVLTTSLAIILAFFRRPIPVHPSIGSASLIGHNDLARAPTGTREPANPFN